MNRRIQLVGLALSAMFVALFIQLNNVQLIKASALDSDTRNGRKIARDFARPRGQIITHDGVVLAKSTPVDDRFKEQREYPEGPTYAHLTGFFSYNFGASGVENEFNDDLTGRINRADSVFDYFGDRTVTSNVTLTIDSRIQSAARDALNGRKGSVVAIDPRSGAILALFSNPTYDPNTLTGHDQKQARAVKDYLDGDPTNPLLARAYQETYAPGSTFKVVTGSAAFERAPELTTKTYPTLNGLVLPNTGGRVMSNFGGGACGGKIDTLLRVSCNSGFGQMGLDLGPEKLNAQAEAFGFNQSVPIDLPRPAKSNFPEAATLAPDNPFLALSAIGQGNVRATPLQMAMVAAGVANGGLVMKPHVMSEVRDSNAKLVRTAKPELWSQSTSTASAGNMRELMIEVVRHGTATRVAIPDVQVAAKTGTAETGVPNKDNAWMIAFAPADAPTIALAVFLENPGGGEDLTGGRNAAPIAKQVLLATLAAQKADNG